MKAIVSAFREPTGIAWHGSAVIYSLLAYGFGIAGLLHASPWINLAATLLLAHGMIIAAYMVHECGHNIVFRKQRYNQYLGRFLTWVCGASYGTFEDIRYKHLRHHVDNDDVVWFDYEKFFLEHPLILRTTRFLEWFYIPAHDLIMHTIMVFTSFIIPARRDQRSRNVAVILVRGGLFLLLIVVSAKAALLYCVAYLIMIQVLRFMDSLQHDYAYRLNLYSDERSPHKGDARWEQEHTFSVPLSLRYTWVNWLTLNFGYHNAHHARPTMPWYRLQAVHHDMFGNDPGAVIPFSRQLAIFHHGRVRRIIKWDDGAVDARIPTGKDFLRAAQRAEVDGGNAASFLTSF
ncbi:MAG TPA: fatty acid desaturase [Woeseiaceae bacterium]|nr:fatty acid desaturase [Woeseiaceae bacterium]